jgi:hypothetical protein
MRFTDRAQLAAAAKAGRVAALWEKGLRPRHRTGESRPQALSAGPGGSGKERCPGPPQVGADAHGKGRVYSVAKETNQ